MVALPDLAVLDGSSPQELRRTPRANGVGDETSPEADPVRASHAWTPMPHTTRSLTPPIGKPNAMIMVNESVQLQSKSFRLTQPSMIGPRPSARLTSASRDHLYAPNWRPRAERPASWTKCISIMRASRDDGIPLLCGFSGVHTPKCRCRSSRLFVIVQPRSFPPRRVLSSGACTVVSDQCSVRRPRREKPTIVNTKNCPICQGEELYLCTAAPTGGIPLGIFKVVPIYSSVCLTCGFVAPALDCVGLSTIREKARTDQRLIHEEPIKQEAPEL